MPGKTAVRPLLNRVVRTACIFTAGSRELLGSRVARKTSWAPRRDAGPSVFLAALSAPLGAAPLPSLDRGPLRVLQREPQLLGQQIDGRSAALPGAFRFEPQVADAAAP